MVELIGKISNRKPKKQVIVKTLGEALEHKNPVLAMWPALVGAIIHDDQGFQTDNLSPPALTLYLCDFVHREVQNGGLEQFFFNTAGDHAAETVIALKDMKAYVFADILERAIALFPEGHAPKDKMLRRELLENIIDNDKKAFSALDDEFNSKIDFSDKELSEEWENQYPLALDFIRRHKEFPIQPEV